MSLSATVQGVRAARLAFSHHALLVAVSLFFVLPSAIVAMSFRPLSAMLVLAGCGGALAVVATQPRRDGSFLAGRIDPAGFGLCCAGALAVLLLGGEGHVFYTTWDWLTRDAVLADLVAHGFPVGYRIGEADYILRAPLGLYMLPALVGRIGGLAGAHGALLVQNTAVLGAIFYLLAKLGKGWPHLFILLLFAGVSIIGVAFRAQESPPFWLRWGLDSWHPLFQFSGSLVQLFWVPNHALPAWWLAALVLLHARREIDTATVGVFVAGALFWSPLAVIPLGPWLIFYAVRHPLVVMRAKRTWFGVAAAVGFLPVLAYLIAGASTIANGTTVARPDFAFWYLLFVVVELPVLLFLWSMRSRINPDYRAPILVSGAVLLALPFFRFGPNNDLVMRGSMVALVVVAFVFGEIVLQATQERKASALAGCLLVVVGAPSALVETGRALATSRYAISDCSLIEAVRALNDPGIPTNYVVALDQMPDWLMAGPVSASTNVGERTCWPDRQPLRFPGVE